LTAVLPDGNDFVFWETEQVYDRELHISARNGCDETGDGTSGAPFASIGAGAAIAAPGTRVIIHAGTYRECVRPAQGGTSPEYMIAYEAAGDGEVVIKASEVATGFARSLDYRIDSDSDGTEPVIWEHALNGEMFHGYNPFGVVNCIHEKNWLRYGRVEKESSLEPYFLRRGMVYVDGHPLRQVQLYQLMSNAPGTYWVEENGLKVHFRMPDNGSPEGHLIEVSCREQNFVPAKPFQSYIKVKGLTMLHAANGAPVPQIGALSCGRGHHWIIEDCVIGWANALGIDIGNEGWSIRRRPDQVIGYAVLRRNQILDCGVCGIAGIGASYTLVEDNVIARTGWQHMEFGWEASALKFHDSVDSLFRRNIFRDSDLCDGLWLDCGNYNDRITQNLFLNIRSPHGMIFMECNRGGAVPHEILIDNNILWDSKFYQSPEALKHTITIDSTHWNEPFDLSTPIGEGISGYGSDDMHIANNLIANMDGMGYSHNIIRGRMHGGRGGTSRNSIVMNNVIYDCRSGAIRLPNHDNTFDGNYYAKMPQGFLVLTYPAPTEQLDLAAWRRFEGYDLHGGYAAFKLSVDQEALTLTICPDDKTGVWDDCESVGYCSMEKVEPDAKVSTDYFGNVVEGKRMPGPLVVDRDDVTISIDPRKL
jgi:hypothetical protein